MIHSLRTKIWIPLFLLISSLGFVFHQSSTSIIRENSREVFQGRVSSVARGAMAYWENEKNQLLRSATLYSESEKIINYSVYGLHNLLHKELKRLAPNSGFSDLSIQLKNGTIVSGSEAELVTGKPINLADPRLNLTELQIQSVNRILEMRAVVPVMKLGEFVGRLSLVTRWDVSRLTQMKRILYANLTLGLGNDLLVSTLNAERERELLEFLYRNEESKEPSFDIVFAGKIYSVAVIDLGETVNKQPIRLFCSMSQEKMLSMIAQARTQTLNLTLLALTVSLILAMFFSEKVLTGRIRQIRDGAETIAQEQFSFRLPAGGRDELGDLARAFNEMAGKLQANHQALMVQNEELQLYIQSLENMKTYIQNILSSLGTGIITWNKDGKVATINAATERELGDIFGSMKTLTIKAFLRKMARDSRKGFLRALRAILHQNQESQPFEIEFDLGGHRGSRIIQGSFTYLRDSDQKPYGMIFTLENITQRKIIEHQLYHADKLSSIGQLAASVAHEIKNPLASIKTLGQLLQEETGPGDSRREYIDVIVAEVNRLNGVVEQLLKYARPEKSMVTLVPVNEIIQPILALVKHELERHRVRLVTQFQENLKMFVDPEKIKQVFLNLIFNAIQAMPAGGEIRIRIFAGTPDPWDIINIEDTGEGMPPDVLARIFDPFFTTKQRGTGLGLAIVKKIVDLHGGKIEVKSNLKTGTVFTIALPHERAEGEAPKSGEI